MAAAGLRHVGRPRGMPPLACPDVSLLVLDRTEEYVLVTRDWGCAPSACFVVVGCRAAAGEQRSDCACNHCGALGRGDRAVTSYVLRSAALVQCGACDPTDRSVPSSSGAPCTDGRRVCSCISRHRSTTPRVQRRVEPSQLSRVHRSRRNVLICRGCGGVAGAALLCTVVWSPRDSPQPPSSSSASHRHRGTRRTSERRIVGRRRWHK